MKHLVYLAPHHAQHESPYSFFYLLSRDPSTLQQNLLVLRSCVELANYPGKKCTKKKVPVAFHCVEIRILNRFEQCFSVMLAN